MNLREIENQISNLRVRSYKYEKKVRELEDKVQDLETKTASDLSQSLVAESATSEEIETLEYRLRKGFETLNLEKENSEKPNNQDFDRQRALELLDIIDFEYWDCVTNKVMENSIEELRQMLGG